MITDPAILWIFNFTEDLQQVMVSGPNLNETSIVSGGYGGTAEGIIPTSTVKGSGLHPPHPGPLATGDEAARGIAVEKFDIVKKWGINTYKEEFGCNAETQKLLCKNGETLLGAVNFFVSSINTLVNKTMEDTLMTVKQYETARLEYDAYRTDLEELSMGPRDASTLCRLDTAQSQFQSHKGKYEKLRADVAIKLKFLEENKVRGGAWQPWVPRAGPASRATPPCPTVSPTAHSSRCRWARGLVTP
ncbi:kinetochore protein NDC80-like protein [Platysternon megacephalum]|uniref:Kinetochore protein NDC80-like protein n=1 Tax=Platysternon megacephalum TaxID=55544 RepID=A0A4D9DLM6_9SAUR|nr:kinetochore protein NDC80-like protein [Platysternon megacephalum]